MKRTIKVSIQDFELIKDSTVRKILENYNNQLSPMSENLYVQYKEYLNERKTTSQFTFEVNQNVVDIFNYIHIIPLEKEIKKLDPIDRFLLTIYVVNTYASSEDKETDELINNLSHLEFEIDAILTKEENDKSVAIDPILNQIIELTPAPYPNSKDVFLDFKDIYLTSGDQIIKELSKEDAIIKLRENKLNQLFNG